MSPTFDTSSDLEPCAASAHRQSRAPLWFGVLALAGMVACGGEDTRPRRPTVGGPSTGAGTTGAGMAGEAAMAGAGAAAGGAGAMAAAGATGAAGTMAAAGAGGIGGAAGVVGAGGMAGTVPMPMPTNGTKPNLKVAFTGDMGVNSRAAAVLKLMMTEGAELTLHAGDMGYSAGPDEFERQLNMALGKNFPYFYSIGNHDSGSQGWSKYRKNMQARINRTAAECTGDPGIKATCTYEGLMFILSGVGEQGSTTDHDRYIKNQLAMSDQLWEVCLWHKNHTNMQVGGKSTGVQLSTYQACLDGGAVIATGHEHSYGRTKTLTDFMVGTKGNFGMMGTDEMLTVAMGSTFVFHSGLGGASIRTWNGRKEPWWSSIYTSNHTLTNGMKSNTKADYGVLFITFSVNGDPRRAEGYFKDIKGNMVDQFTVMNMK